MEDDTNFEDRPPAAPALTEPPPGPTEMGTCGFCGVGDGRLLDQGNESAHLLNATVRSGEAPDWTYEKHPHHHPGDFYAAQYITWCGWCLRGLQHKYQRLDDLNLGAKLHAYKLWEELDGIRWAAGWDAPSDALDVGSRYAGRPPFDPGRDPEAGRLASRKYKDDPATHLDKLSRESQIREMQAEQYRRWSLPVWLERMAEEGWRP